MRALPLFGISALLVAVAGFALVQCRLISLRLPVISAVSERAARGKVHDSSTPGLEGHSFANGVVEGRQRDLSLRFEITGRLLSVEVNEGDRVRAGDLLASLDPSTSQGDLARAKASLARAQAELDLLLAGTREEVRENLRAQSRLAGVEVVRSRLHLARITELEKQDFSAEQERDDAGAAFESAQARHDAALAAQQEAESPPRAEEARIAEANVAFERANVQHALIAIAKTELRSPIDGLVVQRRGEPGELVGPATARPIVILTDASERHVRAFVEEMDALRVTPGDPAFVQADGIRETRFRGRVVSCSSYMAAKEQFRNRPDERVDVKTREVLIRLDRADRPERLLIGLSVDVRIQTTTARD